MSTAHVYCLVYRGCRGWSFPCPKSAGEEGVHGGLRDVSIGLKSVVRHNEFGGTAPAHFFRCRCMLLMQCGTIVQEDAEELSSFSALVSYNIFNFCAFILDAFSYSTIARNGMGNIILKDEIRIIFLAFVWNKMESMMP